MDEPRLEWATAWLRLPKRLYIGGQWADATSGDAQAVVNPANGTTLATIANAAAADVDAAVAAARHAFDGSWRRLTRRERSRVLQRIGEAVRRHRAELA